MELSRAKAGPPQDRGVALEGIRVLEVAGTFGAYAGRLFAGLGADVVLVEPPCGATARTAGPFVGNAPAPENSLTFAYLHAGKRSVTLDLENPEGQQVFRRLAAAMDVIIEGEPAGVMSSRHLGYEDLSAAHPSLVYTSITPFGQTGPCVGYQATDLVLLALGGLLYLGGYPDSEPVRVYGDQAILAADQYAAVGTMLSILGAEANGRGRHVDVAAQECVAMAIENAAQYFELEGHVRRRVPPRPEAGRGVYECRDGYIHMMAVPRGVGAARYWQPMVQMLIDGGSEGAEELLKPQWLTAEWTATEEAKAAFDEVFMPFAMRHTKAQLYEAAQEYHFPLCPLSTPADLLQSPQLKHRDYFIDVPHPASGRSLKMPGAPFKLDATPWRVQRPAPMLGEHNREIYPQFGFSLDEVEDLAAKGVI